MMSEPTFSASSEEPLLGAPPTLSDDEWGEILDSVFEAPPGYADGLVDVFDDPESATGETTDDDHAIDFDGIAGSAGVEGDAALEPEDEFTDSATTDPDAAEAAAAADEDLDFDSAMDSEIDDDTNPTDTGDDFAMDATELDPDVSDDLDGDIFGSDDYLT